MSHSKEPHERALHGQGGIPGKHHDLPTGYAGDVVIPRPDWPWFLDSFSVQHEGWLANLSIVRGSLVSVLVNDARFQKTAIDCAAEKCRVNISVVEDRDKRTYSVPDPLRLTFNRDSGGSHQGLEILSADGSTAILRFRTAARPETLDGVLSIFNFCPMNGFLPGFCGQETSA